MTEIIPILSDSNCYLLKTGSNFILFDTGFKSKRSHIEAVLTESGVNSDNLKLIILSHGDIDHADNARYFREKYNTKIAMHKLDEGMATCGDMYHNRKNTPDRITFFFRFIILLSNLFTNKEAFDSFTPDIYLYDDFNLSDYGLNAQILETPGHSAGSLSVWTDDGSLLCGDLVYNIMGKPKCFMIDDLKKYNETLDKLKKMNINYIFPGHGKPFQFSRNIFNV